MSTQGIISAAPLQIQKSELAPNKASTEETTCSDNTPVMIAMSIVIIALLVPIGVLVSKIKSLNQEETTEMQEFGSNQKVLKPAFEGPSEEAPVVR